MIEKQLQGEKVDTSFPFVFGNQIFGNQIPGTWTSGTWIVGGPIYDG